MTTATTGAQAGSRRRPPIPDLLRPAPVLTVIILGIVARIVLACTLGDQATPVSGAADQYTYDALAQRVLGGHGFSFAEGWYPFTRPNEPTAHWSYLYTLYLTGVYAVFGHHPLAARLIQVLVSTLTIWLTFQLARRLFGQRAGLAAAALHAAYAYFIFFDAALMTQSFYMLALLAAMLVALRVRGRAVRADWLLLGLALGTGTLLRQTLLLFSPILIGWIVLTSRARPRASDLAVTAATLALLVLPWTAYNYRTFGDFLLLNSNGGFWLYSSNHPHQGTQFDPTYAAPLPERLRGLGEPAVDRALYRQAIGFIVTDPVRFLRLTLSRIPDYFWLWPSTQSSWSSNLGRLGSFALYLPPMLWGLYVTRHRWRMCLPLYAYVGFDTALHLASWAAPRYRLPSDAIMMVFAGAAVVDLARRCRLMWNDSNPTERRTRIRRIHWRCVEAARL
ncbi:MAG: glycosyltransferase family 39 protein [Candidatus Binatia bacterium]